MRCAPAGWRASCSTAIALVKLEVLGDPKTLFPDVVQTLQAAEILVKDGFDVMVYTSDDPILAKRLEQIGCVAVMPLAAPIGSGLGIQNRWNLLEIIENAKVPIIVDAGVGTASDAAIAMELGCDGVLMNTAIAGARNPVLMAQRDAQGDRGRPRGVPRRPHPAQALCQRLLADRWPVLLMPMRQATPAHQRGADAAEALHCASGRNPQLRAAPGPVHTGAAARVRPSTGRAYGLDYTGKPRAISTRSSAAAPSACWKSDSATARQLRFAAAQDTAARLHRHRGACARASAGCSMRWPTTTATNVRVYQHDAVEVLEHEIADGVARRSRASTSPIPGTRSATTSAA